MIFSLVFVILNLIQPANNVPFASIEQAFNQKSAENLTKICQDNLLYSYLGKENIYSQAQTQMILKEFFNGKQSYYFKYNFKSNDHSNENYGIATFSGKNEKLRITIYLKKVDKTYKIFRMLIEKE